MEGNEGRQEERDGGRERRGEKGSDRAREELGERRPSLPSPLSEVPTEEMARPLPLTHTLFSVAFPGFMPRNSCYFKQLENVGPAASPGRPHPPAPSPHPQWLPAQPPSLCPGAELAPLWPAAGGPDHSWRAPEPLAHPW